VVSLHLLYATRTVTTSPTPADIALTVNCKGEPLSLIYQLSWFLQHACRHIQYPWALHQAFSTSTTMATMTPHQHEKVSLYLICASCHDSYHILVNISGIFWAFYRAFSTSTTMTTKTSKQWQQQFPTTWQQQHGESLSLICQLSWFSPHACRCIWCPLGLSLSFHHSTTMTTMISH